MPLRYIIRKISYLNVTEREDESEDEVGEEEGL